jgi:putative Mg2+ transporter-C (MgtC) family protein
VKIEAVLLSTSIDGEVLDALTRRLAAHSSVSQAFWSPGTSD